MLLKLWPLPAGNGQTMAIRLRLEPGRLRPSPSPATSFTAADYAQHIMKLKPKIPGPEFTVLIEPPFVVLGDDPPEEVRRRTRGNGPLGGRQVQGGLFHQGPAEILDIWLFKDDASYRSHCRSLFHTRRTRPTGSSRLRRRP